MVETVEVDSWTNPGGSRYLLVEPIPVWERIPYRLLTNSTSIYPVGKIKLHPFKTTQSRKSLEVYPSRLQETEYNV